MINEVSIVNTALSRIGYSAAVTSISPPDSSEEAEQAARFYPIARDRALTSGSWGFNTKRALLGLMEQRPLFGWSFAHALPADYMQVLAVYDATVAGHDMLAFRSDPASTVIIPADRLRTVRELAADEYSLEQRDDGQLVIYSHHPSVVIRYRCKVVNPAIFPPDFADVISWFLAADLAGALVKGDGGIRLAREAMQMGYALIEKANQRDVLQSQPQMDYIPGMIAARYK